MTIKPQANTRNFLMFLLPSLLGLFLFMTPVEYKDTLSIPVAVLAKILQAVIGEYLPLIVTLVIATTGVMSLITKVIKPDVICKNSFLNQLFDVSVLWLVVRLLGAIFCVMTYLGVGSEVNPIAGMITSGDTGALILNDLLPVLLSVFLFAGLFLPLLLNFGLLELIGTLFTRIMRPLFKLPGRSAVNCSTSWLGDGTVGVMLTSKQFEQKIYTQREAAIVGTTFSAVSITFSMVVISQVKLEHLFLPFYLAVCLSGFVAALIMPRIPPLSLKKDEYIDGTTPDENDEAIPAGKTVFGYGLELAVVKASKVERLTDELKQGVHTALDMVFGVLPVVMGIGTIALILAEHTSIFTILGTPFIPYLELLAIPDAIKASETIVVGFADMFLPSIMAASIESDLTRFVVAAMSVSQLIYMSEVGALLLGSKIPVNIFELFAVFILRTLITLPIIAGIAHLIF